MSGGLLHGELQRPDLFDKATGEARYTEDLTPRHLLHCAVVRSPVAAGRLRSVDTSAAEAVRGVVRVITGADLPNRRWGTVFQDQPILAGDVVRFAGEPIALVAAADRAVALHAASLIVADIQERPAVVDLEAAMAPGAPVVRDGEPNVGAVSRVTRGDVTAVFARAAHVVRTRIESHRVHQGYIEPRATLAEPEPGGGLTITTTSQAPFTVRHGLATLVGLPHGRITVKVPTLGGGFGGKLHLGLAPLAAVMCQATRRPVRVVATRAEEMHAGNPRENSIVEMESAVAVDGTITARRTRVYLDSGAYAFDTPVIASIAALQGTGPYRIPALDLEAAPVYTNTCPTGSFRGPSGPQLVYASECHLEDIAAATGIDALELRRRNILVSGDRGPSGELLPDVGMSDCLEHVAARLEAWRADAPAAVPGTRRRRGYGMACAWWLTTGSPSAATITLNEDGTATIQTGGTEIGTGAVVAGVAAIAANELGLPVTAVNVVSGSTGDGPYDAGSKGSRTLYGAGNAVLSATREAVQMLREEAAEQLEAAPTDIELTLDGVGVRGVPSSMVPLAKVVQGALNRTGPIVGKGRFRGGSIPLEGAQTEGLYFDAFNEPTFHCHGAEIELDEATGRVEILRYVAAHDTGPVLNPEGAEGQVEGGVVQGLGFALSEVMDIGPDGIVRNADLVDYRMPTIADIPRSIEVTLIDGHPGPSGPHGAKGIGEAPVILPAAAVGAAVRDILGRQPTRLPMDPIRLCAFMDDAGGGHGAR